MIKILIQTLFLPGAYERERALLALTMPMSEISPGRRRLAVTSPYIFAVIKTAFLLLQVLVVGLAVIAAAQL